MSEKTIVPDDLDWEGKDRLVQFLMDWPSILTEDDNAFVEQMEEKVTCREGLLKDELGRMLSLSDRINDYLDNNPSYQEEPRTPPCNTPDWKPLKKGDISFEID